MDFAYLQVGHERLALVVPFHNTLLPPLTDHHMAGVTQPYQQLSNETTIVQQSWHF
jgi:hypothetical protein